MRRRLGLVLLALSQAVLLSGCWGIAETDKRGSVAIMAIDAAQRGYKVSLGIINPIGLPRPASSGAGGGSKMPVLVRQKTAPSVAQALAEIQAGYYLRLDFAHVDALIVSEQVARQGLFPVMAFLDREPSAGASGYLLVAKGQEAADVLHGAQSLLPQLGLVVTQTVAWALGHSALQPEQIQVFLRHAQIAGDQAETAGVMLDTSQGIGTDAALRITGLAVFRGDRLAGWLDNNTAMGWAVLAGPSARYAFSVPLGTGTYDLQVTRARHKLTVWPGPLVRVQASLGVTLSSVQGVPDDFWRDPLLTHKVESAAATLLVQREISAIVRCRSLGADPFGFGEAVRAHDARDWPRDATAWPTAGMRHLAVQVTTQVHLGSYGFLHEGP